MRYARLPGETAPSGHSNLAGACCVRTSRRVTEDGHATRASRAGCVTARRGAGILEEIGDSLRRQSRINGKIRGAGAQDAQNRDHLFPPFFHHHGDQVAGASAVLPQRMAERGGTLVKLAISQAQARADHGESLGLPSRVF